MAAKSEPVTCEPGTWTRLTDAAGATGDVSVMLADADPVQLEATADGTNPADSANGTFQLLSRGDGWSEATIAEKFPGVASAIHLHAKPIGNQPATVSISHA